MMFYHHMDYYRKKKIYCQYIVVRTRLCGAAGCIAVMNVWD